LIDLTTNKVIREASKEGTLVKCASNVCTPTTNIGYYLNGDTKAIATIPYLECSKNVDGNVTCKGMETPTNVSCNENYVGLIDKYGRLCIDSEGTTADIRGEGEVHYLVTGAIESNIFTGEAIPESIVLTINGNSTQVKEDAFKQGVKLFEVDPTTKVITNIDYTATPEVKQARLKAFMCEDYICYRTYGYFLIGNTIYTLSKKGSILDDTKEAYTGTCSSTTIGKIHKETDLFLCLDYAQGSAVKSQKIDVTSGNEQNYIMSEVASNIFTNAATTDASKYIIVQVGNHAILRNVLLERRGYYLSSTGNVLLVAASATTALKVVACSTAASNVSSCTNQASVVAGYYVHGKENATIIKCTGTAVNTCTLVAATTAGYYAGALKNLIYTSGTVCAEVKEPGLGYYKSEGTSFIECKMNAGNEECTVITNPTSTVTCTADNVGKLVYGGSENSVKLCLAEAVGQGTAQEKTFSNTGTFLLKYKDNNIFGINQNYGGVIKITSNSMTIDLDADGSRCLLDSDKVTISNVEVSGSCATGKTIKTCSNGMCYNVEGDDSTPECIPKTGDFCEKDVDYITSDAEGNTIIKEVEGQTTSQKGYLFQCVKSDSPCTPYTKPGYLISGVNDGKRVYKCKNEASAGAAADVKCERTKIPTETETCTDARVGTIVYKSASSVGLCYGSTAEDIHELVTGETTHMMLKYTNDNAFGITNNQYVVVAIKGTTVTLNADYEKDYGYQYLYAHNTTNKILTKGETCPAPVENVYPISEYECTNGICTKTTNAA